MSSSDFDSDPLNGPSPSPGDSMSDPLNGGPSNWGTAEAMQDNAYLIDDRPIAVGPMALLEGAVGVIKAKPGPLVLIGLASGGTWYGLQRTVGKGLLEIATPVLGENEAIVASQIVVLLLVFSVSLLMQGPLLGVALQAKTNQDGLLQKYGRRAIDRFKTLAGVAGLNLCVSLVAMASLCAAAVALGFVGGLIGELLGSVIGGLFTILGTVVALLVAVGGVMRFAVAAPAVLAEGLPAISAMKRSAELTKGTALAMVFAMVLPAVLWVGATIVLGMFGILASKWVSLVWVAGFNVFFMMLSLAFVPSAYLVYRHFVDGDRAAVVAEG